MIRKGKCAEVTYCRHGETVSPVAGCTREPVPGRVQNGEETVRTVSLAMVTTADLSYKEKPASIHQLTVDKPHTRQVQAVHVAKCQEQSMRPQAVECRDAGTDITLKTLFHQ